MCVFINSYITFIFTFYRRDVLKRKIPDCHAMASILTVKDLAKQGAVVPVAAQVLRVQVALVDLLAVAAVAAAVEVVLFVAAIAVVEIVQVALGVAVLGVPAAIAVLVEVVQVLIVTVVAQIPTVECVKDKRKS